MAFITAATRSDIVELAMGMLNQAPSTTLLNTLIEKSTAGSSIQDLADYIATTAAFQAEYPSTQTAKEFATEMFGKLITGGTISAEINTAVIDLLEGMLTAGTTKAEGFVAVIDYLSNTANNTNADLGDISKSFQNRADAAEYFSITKELGGSTDAELAAAIATVTSDAASLTAANAAADTTASAETVVAGTTTALTVGLDTGGSFIGGAGNDSFTANDTNSALTATFTTGDSIVGGAGTDSLTLAISDGATTPSALVSTSGIEELRIFNNDTGGFVVQGDLMDGLTDVYVTSGQDPITVDNLNSAPNLHLTSTNENATLSATSATTAGTSDAITIASNGAASTTAVLATFDGIETFNLAGSGAATGSATTALTVASTSLETVNVTGSTNMWVVADLTGADNAGEVATFDASAATGNIDATVTAGGSTEMTVKLGTGDDVLTLTGMDKDYTVDGGAGSDRIEVSSAAYSTTLLAAGTLSGQNVTNVEVLGVTAGGSADLRAFTANTFDSLYAAGSATFTGLPATAATLTTLATGALSIDRATDGATDVATINLLPAVPGTFASLNVSDEETVTLSSSGLTAGSNTITTLTGTDLTSLTITGNRDLTVTNAITGTKLATLNAAGLVGQGVALSVNGSNSLVAMTVTGGAGTEAALGDTMNTITTGSGADTVTGGDYKDVITTGAGADSVTAGGGDDTITTTFGNDYVDGGAGNDTITDSVGNDTLLGGAGDDTISSAAGADSIDGGAGNDKIYVTTLGANDDIEGGTGTDVLSAGATSATLAASFYSDVTETSALDVTGVETAYVEVTTTAVHTTTAPLNVDFTGVTGLNTLYLNPVSANAEAFKLTNFGGSSIILSELAAGQDPEFINIDGADQAALTVSVRGFKPASADQADMTVTGVTAFTLTGDSYVSTAAQGNEIGLVTVNSADTVTISTTGTGGYAANANALLLQGVSADNAQTLQVTVGANDTLTSDADIDTGNSIAQTVGVTVGENGTLTISGNDLDLGSSVVNTITVNNGIGGTISTLDIAAGSAATSTLTLNASSTTALDLDYAITSGTATMSTGSAWTLASAGKAGAASALTIKGYGNVTGAGALAGTTFNFNASALNETNGLTVTANALTGSAILSGSTHDDTITGSPQADTITGGNGADTITGGAGVDSLVLTETVTAADLLKFNAVSGTSSDSITVVGAAASAADDTGQDTISGFDVANDVIQVTATNISTYIHTTDLGVGTGTASAAGTAGAADAYPASGNVLFIDTDSDGTYNDAGTLVLNIASITSSGTSLIGAADFLTVADVDQSVQYVLTGTTGNDTITTGDLADTVDGGTGNDTIIGGAGADNITAGAGVDVITPGAGLDTVTLPAGGTVDTIIFTAATDGSGVGVDGIGDTITTFVSGEDKIKLDGALATLLDDIADNTALANTAGIIDGNTSAAVAANVTTTAEMLILDTANVGTLAAANLGDVSAVATILEAQITLTAATGADALLVVESSDVAGKFGIYLYIETGGVQDQFDAADLTVLGIVTGDDVVAADFITT